MANIIKLIFRMDFPTSYALLDSRGAVLRSLEKGSEIPWTSIGDGQLVSSFLAESVTEERKIVISVEATSINGSVDWLVPRDQEKLSSYEEVKNLNGLLSALLVACDVKTMNRVGLRSVCCATAKNKVSNTKDFFDRFMSKDAFEFYGSAAGPVSDVAVTIEGKTDSGVGYRNQFGPLRKHNIAQYVGVVPEKTLDIVLRNDLFFDIDLYEANISFVEHSFYKWASTKFAIVSSFIDAVRS